MIKFPATFPVTSHTDFVGVGSTFVVIQGMQQDGINFIPLALERGAKRIVVNASTKIQPTIQHRINEYEAMVFYVHNTRRSLAELSAQVLDFPAKKLKIIGVTGTKGKTTSVFLIEHMLRNCGYKTALLSTIHNKILDTILPTHLTTQHPDYLHIFLQQCVLAEIDYVIMEVAAQAISLERVYDIEFDAILFTNFDREHGEFYATMEDYFAAKCALLKQSKPNAPVLINADDAWCAPLLEKNNYFLSFSCRKNASYQMFDFLCTLQSSVGNISHNTASFSFVSPLIGEFNVYNILGALGVCAALGNSLACLAQTITNFSTIPGRLELQHMSNGARCFIDFAHNPSSYTSVLKTLRELTEHLIVVCGAGGDRDATKRPIMGALAAEYADIVIFTSDNPRSEDPAHIVDAMLVGVNLAQHHKIIVELDREVAIKKAYELSHAKSVIALLGKGPDHYQIIKEKKIYFNEAEIVKSL